MIALHGKDVLHAYDKLNHTELTHAMLKCHVINTMCEDWYAYYEGAYPGTC